MLSGIWRKARLVGVGAWAVAVLNQREAGGEKRKTEIDKVSAHQAKGINGHARMKTILSTIS
jgi:hypothetical protein